LAYCDDIYDAVDNDVAASPPIFVSEQLPVSQAIDAQANAAPRSVSLDFMPQCSSDGSPNLASFNSYC
jgi:hypothetical protein